MSSHIKARRPPGYVINKYLDPLVLIRRHFASPTNDEKCWNNARYAKLFYAEMPTTSACRRSRLSRQFVRIWSCCASLHGLPSSATNPMMGPPSTAATTPLFAVANPLQIGGDTYRYSKAKLVPAWKSKDIKFLKAYNTMKDTQDIAAGPAGFGSPPRELFDLAQPVSEIRRPDVDLPARCQCAGVRG